MSIVKDIIAKEKVIRTEVENTISKILNKYQDSTGLNIELLELKENEVTEIEDINRVYRYTVKLTPKFPE